MKISILQLNLTEVPSENIDKVNELTKEVSDSVILLPELFTTGFNYDLIKNLKSNHFEILNNLNDKNTFLGSIARHHNNKVYNSFFIKTKSSFEFIYDKIHLFPLMNENDYFNSGKKIVSFDLNNVKCSVGICFDLRFPEIFRKSFKIGSEIIFLPAQWPLARKEQLVTLARARAIENQSYFVLCNAVGNIAGTDFAGFSMVIDPLGNILINCEDKKDFLLSCDIDIEFTRKVRENIPVINLLREDVYGC